VILHDVVTDLGIRDLRTFADAWGVEVIRKDDRAEYVEQLRQIKHKLADRTLVKAKVSLDDLPYRVHMLVRWMLRELLNTPGYQVVIETFHESLIREEQELIEFAKSGRALQNIDRKVTEIYGEVLRAAWSDGEISRDEYHLIETLRQKLGITRRDHRVIEVQIEHFPSKSGGVHTVEEIETAAANLAKRGLLLRVPLPDRHRVYCIPEELGETLRDLYEIELMTPNYLSMLQQVPVAAIRAALEQAGQPFSGTREFLTARAIDGYVSPRTVLRQLTDDQLTGLLRGLPGIRQDGSREIRVRNIVAYYNRLSIAAPPSASQDGDNRIASYLLYYTDLARRAYDVLHATNVISRDKEIERAFEQATTALFHDYFGHEVSTLPGSNHPDGMVEIDGSARVIIWDCKSCNGPYTLTEATGRQFLAYAGATETRIASPMLIIAPDFSADSVIAANKLKTQCRPGTEIALVAADDLKWLAELWRKRGQGKLPWQVLAVTGRLTRAQMEERLKTFASLR